MKLADLLDYDEALALTLDAARAVLRAHPPQTRQRPLWDARGKILAEAVVADRDQPPFDRSAMDGYALRAADVAGEQARLRVLGEIAAGSIWEGEIGPGEAVAIMTGAPLPAGADAVQMVEKTSRDGEEHVLVSGPIRPRQNVAGQGEDVRQGDVVVPAGTVISGLAIGVLASVGAAEVSVLRRPQATVMATGDELVGIEGTPEPAQIRESNRQTILGLLDRAGCRVIDGGIVSDEMADLKRAIREGLETELLVLSGGVSAGVYDLVAEALRAEGVEIVFHKTRIKPGKPVLVGRHEGGLVFGLPGNPVSAYVTAQLLLLPAARLLAGREDTGPWSLPAQLEGSLPATKGRTTFHPGRLTLGYEGAIVRAQSWGGSGDQVGYARGNCLIRREIDAPAAASGDEVCVMIGRGIG